MKIQKESTKFPLSQYQHTNYFSFADVFSDVNSSSHKRLGTLYCDFLSEMAVLLYTVVWQR